MKITAEAASYRVETAIAKVATIPHAKRVLVKLVHLRQNLINRATDPYDVGIRNYVEHLLNDVVVQSVLKSRLAH